ncbi:MAG: Acg family FMN-binding oxidoreductase, partial [Acidimicrobiia bacterium]
TTAGPLALVRAAILAASPHNSQPWLFRFADAWVEVYLDPSRGTGALDPFMREAHIGLGCALENLVLAARPNGYDASVLLYQGTLRPGPFDHVPELVARVTLTPAARETHQLYEAIPHRHTNRGLYDLGRPIAGETLASLRDVAASEPGVTVFLFDSPAQRARIVEAVLAADRVLYSDPDVLHDTGRFVPQSWDEMQRHADGITIDCLGQSPLVRGLLKASPRPVLRATDAYRTLQHSYRDCLVASPMFGIVAVRDRYDRAQSLGAGRLWERLHLWATTRGIAARPINEAIELVDREQRRGATPRADARLAELTGDTAWEPTFMFRIGYPLQDAPASPRRAVEDVVLP